MKTKIYVNAFVKRYLHNALKIWKKGGQPPFFCPRINTNMKDKKAAKLILKRARKNPFLYSSADVIYAKKVKRLEKDDLLHQETKQSQQ